MSDDTTKRGAPDRIRINIKQVSDKADPYADRLITRVSAMLVSSPYTGPLLLAAVVCTAVVLIVVFL